MRVQVNGRYLVQLLTGQQRYAREIVARLADRMEIIRPRGRLRGAAGHVWEQFVLPRRRRPGLLWSPSTTGPLAVREQVVTIHDCAFFDQAECFSRSFAAWYQWLIPRLARTARSIITVSEFSKAQIIARCRVPAEKIIVVPGGVDPRFRAHSADEIAAVRGRLGLPEHYALCVGSLEPRKNLRRLFEAWTRAQPRLHGLQLVVAGASGKVFRDAGIARLPPTVHLAGYLADDVLPAVYAGARLFVYPSVYEGFGLPVLEAMASGVPVVTSNVTALPEVAGGAALTVDPLDVASIAEGIERAACDARLRDELRTLGFPRARLFTWDRAAEQTWRVLEQAA
jgi:glycosyltransferase involved in cell wall biosynthesis